MGIVSSAIMNAKTSKLDTKINNIFVDSQP